VPKPHFTECFCITVDTNEFHAMQTHWNGILDDTLSYNFCKNMHIYSHPLKKRHTFSMLIWYCTSRTAPVAACNWSHWLYV
jgi:hypothetical protein